MSDRLDPKAHWDNVYRTKAADSVSWYRPHLEVSIELLRLGGLSSQSRVIDVGGGASTLVDDVLDVGANVTVLDISAAALAATKGRLRERASSVNWLVADVLDLDGPRGAFDLWHDRAVFHFITDSADAQRYARQAARAVKPGGFAVIAGFAPDGPERCSGLPVARRSAEDISCILKPNFNLREARAERHTTPAGSVQSFAYALLQRL
jgi:SAM-dependent methyltransferase